MQAFGILTMGIGSRAYGEMAVNLANSLKSFLPDFPIAVISDGSVESTGGGKIFDVITGVPRGTNPFELKTCLNKYSPFRKTLWIDADSIFISDPSLLFIEVLQMSFACMNYGKHKSDSTDHPIWATIQEIFTHYLLTKDELYQEFNSSVMTWEKSPETDMFFQFANDVYKSEPCKLIQDVGGYFPDEIAFGVASARLGYYSPDKWQPAYLQWAAKVMPESKIRENYCILTRAGSREDQYIDRIYNSTAAKAAKKNGTKYYPMNIKSKVHARA